MAAHPDADDGHAVNVILLSRHHYHPAIFKKNLKELDPDATSRNIPGRHVHLVPIDPPEEICKPVVLPNQELELPVNGIDGELELVVFHADFATLFKPEVQRCDPLIWDRPVVRGLLQRLIGRQGPVALTVLE